MARQIGQIIKMERRETDSVLPCDTSDLDRLLDKGLQTQAECDQLRQLALTSPSEHIPATPQQISARLDWIKSVLPAQNADVETGQKRAVVYIQLLSGYSDDALAYMVRRACAELDWFPKPRQCLAILADYQRPVTRRDRALQMCEEFTQAMFDQFVAELRDGEVPQSVIDGKPDRWKRICEEGGFLRLVDGKYVQRMRHFPKSMVEPPIT